MQTKDKYKHFIKTKANDLGFFHCGFSKAGFLAEEAPRLENWLKNNAHGKMHYMENHFEKRLDPTLLVEGAKTVVSLLLNYFPSASQNPDSSKISKYAYGEDYHFVIKDKLKELLKGIQEEIGEVNGRVFVDSAPVMDKVWAQKSGLGWVGKHSNLVNPKKGSFFFIAELIIDLELEPDPPIRDYCGTCTRCIDACPTEAIVEPYKVDGSKCISYLTIELKDENLPEKFKNQMENWMFGCDICQDVCPWNRFSQPHLEPRFEANAKMLDMNKKDWLELDELTFNDVLKNTPLQRPKFKNLKRNVFFVKKDIDWS